MINPDNPFAEVLKIGEAKNASSATLAAIEEERKLVGSNSND